MDRQMAERLDAWLTREPDDGPPGVERICPECEVPVDTAPIHVEELTATAVGHENCPTCGGRWKIPKLGSPPCPACDGEGLVFGVDPEGVAVCPGCDGAGRDSLPCPEPGETVTEVTGTKLRFRCPNGHDFEEVEV